MSHELRQSILSVCLLGLHLPCGSALSQQGPLPDPPELIPLPKTVEQTIELGESSKQLQDLITRIALENIPHRYQDDKDWGKTTEIWAGVRVWRDGLRIKTKRRKKEVNHGTWTRYDISLADPEQRFQVRLEDVHEVTKGRIEFDAWVDAALKVFGRVSQWQYGVQLISVGADANARVRLRVRCNVGLELDPTKLPPAVVLDPVVTDADLQIVDFRLRRVSDLGRSVVSPLSHSVREVLEDRIAKRRPDLVKKINRQIEKNRDDLRLSLSDVLGSKWGDAAAKHLDVGEESEDAANTIEQAP